MLFLDNLSGSLPFVKTQGHSPLALGIGARLQSRRDTLEAECELRSSSARRLRIERNRSPVDVVNVVARLVVARVGRAACTSEDA
jgi:hypothetical protein